MTILPGTPPDRALSGKERVARLDDTLLFSWQGEEARGTQVVACLWNGQQAIGYLGADNCLRQHPITAPQQALLELYATTLGHLCTLKQREEALSEADRRKDQSLAMLAHELRNPLAPIRNAVELLKQRLLRGAYYVSDKGETPPDTEYAIRNTLAVIDRQVRHQARLLDDLLDLSRIGQGKIELRCGRLDLARLVREAVEDHHGVLAAAGLTLALELPDRPVWVEGDATRLAQVVGNLLTNAGKFTPAGGTVGVGCWVLGVGSDAEHPTPNTQHPTPNPPSWRVPQHATPNTRTPEPLNPFAAVVVSDTGIGIEPEMLPRVFDAFAQAERALAHGQQGLGLGLALVKGLVERHGGQVRAESSGPGQGARFTLTLPLSDAPAAPVPARPAVPVLAGPLRVLIIDDHPDAAETLRELLELFDCTVEVAHNGLEGVEAGPRFRPDVVLCDLGLPGLDGYGVAAALRSLPETAHVRLIALSGRGQEEDQRRAHEAGFDLHLTKPVDFDALRELLEVAPARDGRV